MDETAEARHPIRVVAQRTGLTPATIRAWERRYGAVVPTRSGGGQRVYSDLDVQRLRTLKALTDAGRGISMVAGLSPMDAEALLTEDLSTRTLPEAAGLIPPPTGVDSAYEDELFMALLGAFGCKPRHSLPSRHLELRHSLSSSHPIHLRDAHHEHLF